MLALPHVSGTECIAVLERFGYRLLKRSGVLASLRRDENIVVVPDSATLGPAVVASILRAAHIDALDFVRDLDEHASDPTHAPTKVA